MIALRARRMSRQGRRELLAGLLFISPWIIGFLCFTLYPLAKALYYSFTDFNLLQTANWVGLDNYRTALTNDPLFWLSLGNTLIYVALTIPAGTVVTIMLALLLNARVRGLPLFRTLYYMPNILPTVATAVVWGWVLEAQFGLLNDILRAIGIRHPPGWLTDAAWTKPSFALMSIWTMGSAVLIYLAALQGVPQHLYEAAELDGAGATRRFWHVTVPMISPAILFNVVLGLIGAFQIFTQAYVLENSTGSNQTFGVTIGGPLQSALFYVPYLWENAFVFFKMGYASALAWILFAIILVATLAVLQLARHRVYYEEAL